MVVTLAGRVCDRNASGVELAVTRRARRRGLLGRDGLAASEALYLAPCFAIHTAFMRFAIDVLFLDETLRVAGIEHAVAPGRLAGAHPRSHHVLELHSGTAAKFDLLIGDRMAIEEVDLPSALSIG